MKILGLSFQKIILLLLLILLWIGTFAVHAYELKHSDNEILDRAEERLIWVIDDTNNRITAQMVINYIDILIYRHTLSERKVTLLRVIQDDLEYIYYLWEYANIVYSAEDCYEGEYFDEGDQRCYFDSESIDYDDITDFWIDEGRDFHEEDYSQDDILASYTISGDSITLESSSPAPSAEDREIWNIFTTIIPPSARKDFKEFHVVNSEDSDTGAHVEQDSEDFKMWNMTVNLASFYNEGSLDNDYVYSTLIHEFAHVLTLSQTQMRYYPVTTSQSILERFAEDCRTNLLHEGCLYENAYLDDFIDIFWADSEYLERVRNEEVSAFDDSPESFITDYAATNPWEDIAESFTYFVLRPRALGSSIADKKLQFFYDYKELEGLRAEIRSRITHIIK